MEVGDAMEYVTNWSGEKFDAILVDVNAEGAEDKMLSPAQPFCTVSAARKNEV